MSEHANTNSDNWADDFLAPAAFLRFRNIPMEVAARVVAGPRQLRQF